MTIGASVSSIGLGAFSTCSIQTLNYNADSCYLSSSVFGTLLTTVNIGDNVRYIPSYAFQNCAELASVSLPNALTSIGNNSFEGCISLSSIVIPNRVTSVGVSAFKDCHSLSSLTLSDHCLSIEDYTFGNCYGLTNLTIPPVVEFVENTAFADCPISTLNMNAISLATNSNVFGTGITTLNLGEQVHQIPSYLFQGCVGLTDVEIPSSVERINGSAFSGCTGLSSIVIPNSVLSIGDGAFQNCSGLTSLTLGNGVETIGSSAFKNCGNLPSITIPNAVTSIGSNAFQYCTSATTLNLGTSVETIGSSAFSGCTALISLSVPVSTTSIESSAFSGCSGLTSAVLGDGVRTIGGSAFRDCSRLTSVQFGESLEEIGSSAFRECGIIGHVYFPQSVISMGERAFYECYGITEITCLGRVAPLISNDDSYSTFYGVDTNIVVNIPCDSYNLYSGRWSYFHNFSESAFLFNVVSENLNKGTVTVVSAPTCSNPVATVLATPRSGYRFDHWSDGSTENPYYYTVTGSMTLTAYFVSAGGGTEGIEDIADEHIKIYSRGSEIVIEGAESSDALVYDVMGRIIHKGRIEGPIHVDAAGIYMVKIGDQKPQKVVVR